MKVGSFFAPRRVVLLAVLRRQGVNTGEAMKLAGDSVGEEVKAGGDSIIVEASGDWRTGSTDGG